MLIAISPKLWSYTSRVVSKVLQKSNTLLKVFDFVQQFKYLLRRGEIHWNLVQVRDLISCM